MATRDARPLDETLDGAATSRPGSGRYGTGRTRTTTRREESFAAKSCLMVSTPGSEPPLKPTTGQTVPLFHPRAQRWREHFTWQGALLVGLTPIGRATIRVLNINDQERQRVRLAADR